MKLARVRYAVTTFVLACVAGSASVGMAQQSASGDDPFSAAMQQELLRSQALQTIQADRDGFIDDIFLRWADLADDGGTELRAALSTLSDGSLLDADLADSAASLNESVIGPTDLGDTDTDLVFFPVTPCRIIDTRNAGGILAAGVPRNFDSQGPFTSQGGDAGNCGLPTSDTAALALTVIAVTPSGPGNLRLWPAGDPLPLAVAINYSAGLNLSNTTIVPLKQDVLNADEFSAQANVSNVHLVADVVGYFWSPTTTPLQQSLQASAAQSISAGGTGTATSPVCPTGYTVTGGSCIITSFQMHLVTSRRSSSSESWFCSAENEGAGSANLTAQAICSRIPGR